MLLGEGSSWGPFNGSLVNLAAITIERYLKVVHPVWAKNKRRKWMTYSTNGQSKLTGGRIAAANNLHSQRSEPTSSQISTKRSDEHVVKLFHFTADRNLT